jgi:hypothetical protein
VLPEYPIAALSKRHLQDRVGRVEPVGARDPEQIIAVWSPAGRDGRQRELQVWVNPFYGGYRDGFADAWRQAWEATLGRRLSTGEVNSLIEPGYEVDHIFPKSVARRNGYSWVRLFPIQAHRNRSWSNLIDPVRIPLQPLVYLGDARS